MSKPRLLRITLPGTVLIALGLLIALLAAGSPDRASAQAESSTEVLVSNTGKPVSGHRVPNDVITYAQAFDTGSNANGYELDSVVLAFASAPAVNATLRVTVQEESSTTADTPSGTALYTLPNPGTISTGLNEFAAPADAELSANTTYFVVAEYNSRTGGPGWRRVLLRDGLDSGAAAGWNIDANYLLKVSSGNWGTDSATRAFQIQVKGAAKTGSDSSPSFGAMASIPDMAFAVNKPNTSGFLPLATGGDAPLTYSVKEALPAGLSYSSTSGAITGTPSATAAAATYTFVATDSNGDTAELTFSLAVTANSTPSFGMSTVANQVLTKDAAMTPVALPAATGGNAPLRHSFSPTLPAGLSFEKSGDTYRLKGTPTTPQDATSYTWQADDSDNEFAAVSFTITVMPNAAPSFGAETIANQTYIQHRKITDLTLPAATGGDGALTYTLTGPNGAALPAGLSFDAATRKLTGTPTASQAATTYTYTVTDSDTANPDSATLTFTITVTANAVPSFGAMASIPDMAFAVNRGSFSTDLPRATGGDTPLTYSVKETLPAGLSYSLGTIMGTPSATAAAATYTFVATDSDGDTAELTFSLAVTANSTPSFGMSAVANQVLTKDAAMTPVALPAATGGNAPLRYSFHPTLPAGLSFEKSGDTYRLKGTPTARQDATSYTWRADDSDYEFAAVNFTITIVQGAAPSFGANTISNQSYTQNTPISDLTLPTATGGDGTLSYALVGTLPAGLEFNSTTRKITGTPTATQAATTYTWSVTDNDGDKAELTFTITVSATSAMDTKPQWVFDGTFTVLDLVQEYAVGAAVDLTLPRATGDGPMTYSLTPEAGATLPAGLNFYAPTRRLTGVPTTAQPLTGYTYMVSDADGDTAKFDLAISVAVSPGARQHPLIDDIMIVSWTRSTDTGVTGYLVQWKSGDQQYSTTERSHTAGPTDSSSEISDLPLGVYTVKVTQQGGAGDGNSVEYTVTLHGWPGVVYVDPVAGNARAVDVEWETVSTAAGYVIEWKLASADSYPQANRASVTAGSLNYRTATDGYTGETVQYPTHRVTGLQPNTEYEARVTVYTAAGSATSPDGLSHENSGTTHAEITGLTAVAVDGQPTQLTVSWNTPPDSKVRGFEASGYLLQWKTGSDDYNDGTSLSPRTSTTITGLTAGTAYTVRLTVKGTLFGATADGDSAEASGTTSAATGTGQSQGASSAPPGEQSGEGSDSDEQQSDSTPAISFVIYYDPDAGDAAADRYNEAVALLDDAGIAYSEVRGDVRDDVDRLAGVTDSIIPRFFLSDPTEEGWVSKPKVNNGGLRWLKQKVAELSGD